MSLKIIKAGLLDTIQDGGRKGYAHLGIPPGGAMDPFSASLANALLGKELGAPVIEMHFPAPVIQVHAPVLFCMTGADFSAQLNDEDIPLNQPVFASSGILQFRRLLTGARAYLAFLPEMQVSYWLGSAATDLKLKEGGFRRRLVKDDVIAFAGVHKTRSLQQLLPWKTHYQRAGGALRVIEGPEWSWLTAEGRETFLEKGFTISPVSDRMGFRLGGEIVEKWNREEMLSSAVTCGTIQLLPDGNPVVLMADHPTTGGYPRIASLISVESGRLAQMQPGTHITFELTTMEKAEQLCHAERAFLQEMREMGSREMKKITR